MGMVIKFYLEQKFNELSVVIATADESCNNVIEPQSKVVASFTLPVMKLQSERPGECKRVEKENHEQIEPVHQLSNEGIQPFVPESNVVTNIDTLDQETLEDHVLSEVADQQKVPVVNSKSSTSESDGNRVFENAFEDSNERFESVDPLRIDSIHEVQIQENSRNMMPSTNDCSDEGPFICDTIYCRENKESISYELNHSSFRSECEVECEKIGLNDVKPEVYDIDMKVKKCPAKYSQDIKLIDSEVIDVVEEQLAAVELREAINKYNMELPFVKLTKIDQFEKCLQYSKIASKQMKMNDNLDHLGNILDKMKGQEKLFAEKISQLGVISQEIKSILHDLEKYLRKAYMSRVSTTTIEVSDSSRRENYQTKPTVVKEAKVKLEGINRKVKKPKIRKKQRKNVILGGCSMDAKSMEKTTEKTEKKKYQRELKDLQTMSVSTQYTDNEFEEKRFRTRKQNRDVCYYDDRQPETIPESRFQTKSEAKKRGRPKKRTAMEKTDNAEKPHLISAHSIKVKKLKLNDGSDDVCYACGKPGEIISCNEGTCTYEFHAGCMRMRNKLKVPWLCPCHYCSLCNDLTQVRKCMKCLEAFCVLHWRNNIFEMDGKYMCRQHCPPAMVNVENDLNGSRSFIEVVEVQKKFEDEKPSIEEMSHLQHFKETSTYVTIDLCEEDDDFATRTFTAPNSDNFDFRSPGVIDLSDEERCINLPEISIFKSKCIPNDRHQDQVFCAVCDEMFYSKEELGKHTRIHL